jgi:hypothetical protein
MGTFYSKKYFKDKNQVINQNQVINYDDEFWEYCGINISVNIKNVPAIDNINIHSINHIETEMAAYCKPYTIEEYQQKFAVKGIDGKLYWKKLKL